MSCTVEHARGLRLSRWSCSVGGNANYTQRRGVPGICED
ncbi:hypothetical protein HaLaN_07191, partial [Haematococcus lacustris]